jgi:hypothetical protein
MKKLVILALGLFLAGSLCLTGCPQKKGPASAPEETGAKNNEKKDAVAEKTPPVKVMGPLLDNMCKSDKLFEEIYNVTSEEFKMRLSAPPGTVEKDIQDKIAELKKQLSSPDFKKIKDEAAKQKFESCSASASEITCDKQFKDLADILEKAKAVPPGTFEKMKAVAGKMGITSCGLITLEAKVKGEKEKMKVKFISVKTGDNSWKILTRTP